MVDGELSDADRDEILTRLSADTELVKFWERCHLVGDIIRQNVPVTVFKNFADNVKIAVADEPVIFAPQPKLNSNPPVSNKTSDFSFVAKRVAGFAIAASVATIAVVGIQLQNQGEDSVNTQKVAEMPLSSDFVRMTNQASQVAATTTTLPVVTPKLSVERAALENPSVGNANTVILEQPTLATVRSSTPVIEQQVDTGTSQKIPEQIKFDYQVHKYLVDHNQFISGSDIQGLMPYARIISSTEQISPQK